MKKDEIVLTAENKSGIVFEIKAGMDKGQEIRVLKNISEAFASLGAGNSYLGALFSPKLVKWVEAQINDDLSCDLIDALGGETANLEEALAEVRKLRREDMEEKARAEECLKVQQERLTEKDRSITSLEDMLRITGEEYDKVREQWQTELVFRRDAEKKIEHLKAKLYDLIVKEG